MKPHRCRKMTATLLTDEAARRLRVWVYGRLILGLKPQRVRRRVVWRKKWKVKKRC